MEQEKVKSLLEQLRKLPMETEWAEFKVNNFEPQAIGEYISALSNAACLHKKKKAYLVFGIENETHNIVGTKFKPKKKKVGNQELENWLITQLSPGIDFVIHEVQVNGNSVVIFEIDAAGNAPVKFKGKAFIRVGSYKQPIAKFPEKERKIWTSQPGFDWSAQICDGATINDLDPKAILKAREEYKQKHPHLADEVTLWDDRVFLNKAKVTIEDGITRTALILLGKEDSYHFLIPAAPQISWILKDENNIEKDYAHFSQPFILNIEKVFNKIRNLNYRYMPDGTLFPIEITQYDPWVIREALHNCIAHQDYELKGRIHVVEKPDQLIFSNLGHFIPGRVETVLEKDAPSDVYRNLFLANAMVNLNMIDTIGSGIKKMFLEQRKRFFPLPDFDLSQEDKTVVKIFGKILDKNYSQLLMKNSNLSLKEVFLLDKVQKNISIKEDEYEQLKKLELVNGGYPNTKVISQNGFLPANGKTILKVYISSTYIDLKDYRQAAIEVVNRYKCMPLGMEFFSSQPRDADTVSEIDIKDCDVFVGIYAHRYGYIPAGGDKSITHQEYELAKKSGKDCLCFIVQEDYPWNPKDIDLKEYDKLNAFLNVVRKENVTTTFESPADFSNKLSVSIGRLIMSKKDSASQA